MSSKRIGYRHASSIRHHSCDREIHLNGWAMSGTRQPGDRWTCSCGKIYQHLCDEAEDCCWVEVADAPAPAPTAP